MSVGSSSINRCGTKLLFRGHRFSIIENKINPNLLGPGLNSTNRHHKVEATNGPAHNHANILPIPLKYHRSTRGPGINHASSLVVGFAFEEATMLTDDARRNRIGAELAHEATAVQKLLANLGNSLLSVEIR